MLVLGPGACREVLEETGVSAVFESVLAFRHAHAFAFNNSDLFFVAKYAPSLVHSMSQRSEALIDTLALYGAKPLCVAGRGPLLMPMSMCHSVCASGCALCR